ncbi:MAG: phage/plasmid primase, P4 family [Selenomonas sp.]|nr:phage/plasmid primase, P4 family [Selenomonas sp.]
MKMTIYTADCRGNAKNNHYPNKHIAKDVESLLKAISHDHVCAAFEGNLRSKLNFRMADCLVMDCDNEGSDDPADWVTIEQAAEMLRSLSPNLGFVIVPSKSHMKEKDGKSARPRFHVYFPHRTITSADAEKVLKTALSERFPFFDKNALDAARFIFGCEVQAEDVLWNDGTETIDGVFHEDVTHTIPEGQRNATMSRFAGRVVKRYGVCDRAHEVFLEEAKKCTPPLEDTELATIWQSACRFGARVAKEAGYVSPDEYNKDFSAVSLKPGDYSDIGQAKVIAREYGDEICYTDATDYLHYNGKRWVESRQDAVGAVEQFLDLQLADASDAVQSATKALIDSGVEEGLIAAGGRGLMKAIGAGQTAAYDALLAAKTYFGFVMKRRDMRYIVSAMVVMKPMVNVSPDVLDADGFLLNTPAGTYDLRKGLAGCRPHTPGDHITKMTEVAPGETGRELWLDAIHTTFGGDAALASYVQEIVGICAIGRVYLEQMIICYGRGANGKSTFWNTIARVLGSYSGSISADTLTVGCKRNVKPELAETQGKRLLIAAELEEGMRLSTSIVKQLCSTDAIQGEKKYKAPFSFIPTHTLVLYTNHLPKVGARDEGIWRRLVVIPFTATIQGKKDIKNYSDFLVKNAGPAILSWVIEGAKKAIDHDYHLALPPCVQEAIAAYREDNDWLASFINACCEVGEDCEQASGKFYETYRSYCALSGDYVRDSATFYGALEQADFKRVHRKNGRFIIGLRLRDNALEDFLKD